MSTVLVLYVFHIYNDRVRAFIKDSIFYDKNIDFIIISNDKEAQIHISDNNLTNVKVIYRNNIGYDFGGWSEALLTNNTYKKYDKFIFVNSSVSGPFLPIDYKGKWTDIYLNGLEANIKLFGSTINTQGDPLNSSHVQSYIFSMDRTTLEYLIRSEIFSNTVYAKDFDDAIKNKEILMSRKIIENNWNIGSLLPLYKGVDFTFATKKPEEYNIKFLGDIMYENYRNNLWKDNDLVFIKGNRINIEKNSKEGFSDYGGVFYIILLVFFVISLVLVSIKSYNMLFKTVFKRIYNFIKKTHISFAVTVILCIILYYLTFINT